MNKDVVLLLAIRWLKFIFAGCITLLFRLITPLVGWSNVSLLMATQFAGSVAFGPWVAGLYGSLSMFLLDAFMGALGPWTIATSICQGIVGVVGGYYLARRSTDRQRFWSSTQRFLTASIVGTLFFDLVTGVLLAPLYHTPMSVAAIGQVPFTARHLVGNMIFATMAPWFTERFMKNLSLEARVLGFAPHP